MGRRTRKNRRFWERGWFVTLGIAAVVFVSYQTVRWAADRALPDVSRLKTSYPIIKTHRAGKPFTIEWSKSRPAGWVGLGSISRAMVQAVIVSEDSAFFQHEGFDTKQIRETIEDSIKEGSVTRGASTITQQVAKNVFLSQERSLMRKLREAAVTVELESNFNKRKILEVYFNIAEWGPGIFGIGRASHYYFGKSPAALRPREAAFLAMLLPSPIRYGQSFKRRELTRFAMRRIRDVTLKLVQTGVLTHEERERDLSQPFGWEKVQDRAEDSFVSGDEESWFADEPPAVAEPPSKGETVHSESETPATSNTEQNTE